jgi:hypothetical protein
MKKNSFITNAIVIKLFSWSHTVVQCMNKASTEAKGLTHKCKATLEKLAGGKRSSLFCPCIIDEEN